MQRRLADRELATLVSRQVESLFPDGAPLVTEAVLAVLPETMRRVEHCFSRINNKYFFDGRDVLFDHLNGDQYAMFLYLLANTAHRSGLGPAIAAKLYRLNKALHGLDAFYEVELPSVFMFVHPLATVLGRGAYSDYLLVYQRCGVGSNHDEYPELGEHVTLRPGSSVLGRCRIGARCTIAAESLLLDRNLDSDSIYIGNPRDHVIRKGSGALALWRTAAS